MMGSSNQEEIIHGSSSLVAATPTLHGVGSNNYEWNQALMLNCGDFTSDANEVVSSIQREFIRPSHEVPTPPLSSLLLQDLGLQWSTGNADSFMSHPDHQLNLSKIKQELSADALISKLNEHYQLNEKLFLWSTSPLENSHNSGLQPPASNSPYNQASFAFDLPSATTTARLGLPPLPLPGSADMNIHALHLLASARVLGRSFCQPSLNGMALLREDIIYGPSNIQEAVQGVPTSCSHEMVPSLVSGVTEPRPTNSVEHKASQIVLRKPRFESRSSFSSFKVRKEKLGDRIAALQQIVAPFGKTDTASVLMEAIGYIKFLQSQVETLSVPYRRPSNKKLRTMQGVANDEKDEPKLDLRSRGLCLVPLSCTSYVTNENGGVW